MFTLHHVIDPAQDNTNNDLTFSPNRILDITPGFLDQTLELVKRSGFDIITLDEVRRRLLEKDFSRKFVSFTLDDGYQDNYLNAYPVFRKHNAPFTVYVATAFPEGQALLWWDVLEQIIHQNDHLEIEICGVTHAYSLENTTLKYNAWDTIYRQLRTMPEPLQRKTIARLAESVGVDTRAHCTQQSMNWDTLKTLAADDLVTIGAHTVNHFALRKLPADQVIEEATRSRIEIEKKLGKKPLHFSYPYGDSGSAGPREFEIIQSLGFHTATTTRKAMLYPEHAAHLQALPRISLNGDFQSDHYTRLFLTGAPFALSNRFQKIVVG
ncbi:MAG TPA: polysaccharide deacetylase [Gammaproteobacteria bacterium]|nr:polysaccharide deacetylase [Gammaproteobacteria bacterium]